MRRLLHFPLCPFSRKVRVALREKGLACELVEVQPWEGKEELLALNPASEVPVLVDEDLVVADSGVIGEYLDEAYPEQTLLGRSLEQRNETRRLVSWFDSKFAREVTDLLWREKLLKRLKRSGTPNSEALRTGAANIRGHLAYVAWLFDGRRWLAGDELTMADIAAASHLSVLDYLGDVPWGAFPAARDWYAKIKSRPSFRPLLMDRLVGVKPPQHYDDLDF
ncbi:MAG TPA: glutathione S-transferase family protein [Geminicoccaceae bacterium]|nr:glutathione S-transferase family protein [Geminicoccaceae bacterium]